MNRKNKIVKGETTLKLVFMALAVFALSSSCSDEDDSNVTDNDSSNSGQISYTVDGEDKSFEASALHIITDDNTPNTTTINDNAVNEEENLQIAVRASPGDLVTYDVSNLEDSDNHVIVGISYSDGNGTFFNTSTSDGQISISEYTDSSLSGSFDATLENPVSGEQLSLSNGTFTDLVVTESTE